MAHETTLAGEPGDGPAPPRVEGDGPRFRVRTAKVSTPWRPDTPSKRHLTVVGGRLLRDEDDTPCVSWQAGAALVGRANRQAASPHRADVRQGEEDVRALVWRQRQVEATVVDGVLPELLQTPGAGPTALVARVNAPLGRDDLTAAHIERALAQISWVPVRRTLRRQWAAGHVQDHEAWLLSERLEHLPLPATPPAGGGGPSRDRGMRRADPTALAALVTPARPLAPGPGALCWLTCLMTLFSWHVPGSVWGRWCGVHQTTIGRWVVGLALALWPLIARWLGARVHASMVPVEEQWRKLRGRWHEWCVGLAGPTELPVLAARLPSRGPWACRWVGRQLRQLKTVPQGLSTEGGPA